MRKIYKYAQKANTAIVFELCQNTINTTYMHTIEVLSCSMADTDRYAQQISRLLQPGDVVILAGDLGTGKTAFTKQCCQALGYTEVVTSPSYTLANIYSQGEVEIVHADFYRIKNESELFGLGLDYYIDTAIMLIEWGDRFEDFFDSYLKISMEHAEGVSNGRKWTITYEGDQWEDKFKQLEIDLAVSN